MTDDYYEFADEDRYDSDVCERCGAHMDDDNVCMNDHTDSNDASE